MTTYHQSDFGIPVSVLSLSLLSPPPDIRTYIHITPNHISSLSATSLSLAHIHTRHSKAQSRHTNLELNSFISNGSNPLNSSHPIYSLLLKSPATHSKVQEQHTTPPPTQHRITYKDQGKLHQCKMHAEKGPYNRTEQTQIYSVRFDSHRLLSLKCPNKPLLLPLLPSTSLRRLPSSHSPFQSHSPPEPPITPNKCIHK
ncbi:hypothetical protein DL95DRAFT_110496 [Leptodontidium sp. 2 PMI_412]|nr:hypothetical protein DL95DRAFT_110496 [Leptodontidium sp. 2 PMI_412]